MADQAGRIRVGTAAWSDHEEFYPKGTKPGDRITYYARHFPVVEVNASYYHIMPSRNYAGWAEKTPDDFVFNVKAFGVLTGHRREEAATPEVLVEFRNRTWLTGKQTADTLEFLKDLGLSYVTVDAPQIGTGTAPLVPAVTNTRLAYLRMHGRNKETWYKRVETTGERFNYLYNQSEINELAGVARKLAEQAQELHVIFSI